MLIQQQQQLGEFPQVESEEGRVYADLFPTSESREAVYMLIHVIKIMVLLMSWFAMY